MISKKEKEDRLNLLPLSPTLLREAGFEQFVILQLMAYVEYRRMDLQFYYWRTHHGAEVDVLLCRGNRIICALEIKSSQHISAETFGGLKSFVNDNPDVPAYIFGRAQKRRRLHKAVMITNWNDFILEELEMLAS